MNVIGIRQESVRSLLGRVPGESGLRQSGMFWTSGSVESLPNGDSPQELQAGMQQARHPGLSGSGFASTGPGEGGRAPA